MPAARISSAVAGRRPPVAFTAFASFVSLTSKSPRTMAVTRRPSPVTKKAAFAVREVGTPRKRGQGRDRLGARRLDLLDRQELLALPGGATATRATCWLAA